MPKPNAGCMIKKGKATVMMPKINAYKYGFNGIKPILKGICQFRFEPDYFNPRSVNMRSTTRLLTE